ncbi:tRNA-dihydrouridine20a/20b 20b synthase NADP+-like [Octopus vulgaris]|uniref:tRNA-dihydrouridine20a/20b 20b synthase NADP+-like n=2 Tax=Octopus TaxID=6643 RepID=A0AA36F2F8_OCTVU|nr:tRNA-dihydrouridine(20a/20b) synthase [NAD(P)+]-like [Octopus sinensis]XP_029635569.1 tRNA-dihydrouridine(20a/20b) synthase [NAD(P)+]-like [Octopus sinensis]XP_036357755.1 tRNA-dihydrouridine(20a/20b) synthase [NAD(P)+]-like [Octopus sinensis]CAI9722044.1 tRNA-dihydrouridine20a/20b 20b synthase NADP+-like [Octopus vulgaris]
MVDILDASNSVSRLSLLGDGEEQDFKWKKPLELFAERKFVRICAPMVRYSKLPFRLLTRKYGVDLAYTPMIVSNSFLCSLKARDSDFTTCNVDRPLIVQFAASNTEDFVRASQIVVPYADGVDLNCGCPQRWAQAEGYGACLLRKPEIVQDMIRQTKGAISSQDFTISIKIRIHHNIRETVEFCRKMEHAGLSWLAVHGRTPEQRGEPVNNEAIQLIKSSVNIPVIANGDVKSLEGAKKIHTETKANGIMAARGILSNPSMFAGYQSTPEECVKDWIYLALSTGTSFQCFHHHLTFMLQKAMSRAEQTVFASLASTSSVLQFLKENFGISAPRIPVKS